MWGIFDETGVFLALCQHGSLLVIADMIASRKLSKYLLAVVDILLDAFGINLSHRYDIGCKFKTTINKSDLSAQAYELRFTALVRPFHGYVHNQICQLSNLATYVKSMGLEDLEGYEQFFSKSNVLTASTCYANTFLIKNYQQALDLLAGEDAL
ncbi:hypothetical protein C0995_001872 [Termitomyces sp. Mi166|nr:hypothetical protein C0995_001872 [Termitomyces sp. Mi166\